MGSALLLCGFGLLLGMRHATDADHLVALSTIVSKQRSVRRAAAIGSAWGVGHTVTIFLVGAAIILLNVHIPPRVGLTMEFCVALMLTVLGALNLTGLMPRIARRAKIAGFAGNRSHDSRAPGHSHNIGTRQSSSRWSVYLRPLFIGLVHGLAGSAAAALLVLSTIHSPAWATLYLLIFGLGTILGMMLMTTAIAVPLRYSSVRFERLNGLLVALSGVISLCFGLFLVYRLGYVGGLFGPHPTWVPE